MRAPVCISPSNRSNRSASASVTERDKRLAEKSVEKPVANRAQGLTHFFAFVAGLWCASEPGNGLRATVDRPRAVCGAVVSRVDAAGARSRTCNNLLSLNRVYNYGMISVTCSRPFSELGDQQLLEQTKRLAANQRGIDVHILDHLDEIDRRGLALRRGFSSLFDYAVRELRFTDAAAQRRIQAMRLCRRHGWVRACLQSGELSMTAAGQLETTFAGAERAERQSHTGHRNVGQGCCHDQDHGSAGGTGQLGLPAAPGEAGEQRECGPRSAPELAPRAEQCSDDAAAVNSPVVPVVSYAGAQAPGAGHAGHAGALLQRPELNGHAAPSPAPSCDRAPGAGAGAGAGAGPAAPSSDEGPAPQPLPPTDLPAQASAPAPAPVPVLPVAAPSVSLPAASLASEPLRDDPFAELSPGPVSAAPLLHPQRQRELIEQAAGMSTRQVANLLAAAAPEVLPPRDTLRAAAPDRYTLKVSIDQECEQGLRLLKDVMSHVDPRMSWGDLVARVVREAVTRHDPRGGGRGQRRKGAGSAGASPRRAPKETRAAGAEVGPAQRVETNPRRGRRTGHVPPWRRGPRLGAEAARLRRRRATPPLSKGRIRSRCWPTLLHHASQRPPHSWTAPALAPFHRARTPLLRRRSWRPRHCWMAPASAALHRARTPLLRRRSRRPRHCWMAPAQVAFHRARQPLLRRCSRHPRHCWMAPAQAALHRARTPLLRRRSRRPRHCWMAPASAALDRARPPLLRRRSSRPAPWRMAPMPAEVGRARRSPLRRRSRHLVCPLTADRAARRPEQRAAPRRLASLRAQACRARRSPLRRRSRHLVCPPTADRPTHQPGPRRTRPANLFTAATNPRRGATFPRRSGATSGSATVDAAVIAIRSPGGAAPLPICCRSTTCCQSPRGVARSRPISMAPVRFAHHSMRHGYGPAAPPEAPM